MYKRRCCGSVAQSQNRLGDPVLNRIEKSMQLLANGTLTPAKQGKFQRGLRLVNGLRGQPAFSVRSWAKQAWGTTMLAVEMNPSTSGGHWRTRGGRQIARVIDRFAALVP